MMRDQVIINEETEKQEKDRNKIRQRKAVWRRRIEKENYEIVPQYS